MTQKKSNRTLKEIKAMMGEDDEFLRPMVHAVIQEFLEAERAQAVGAEKGERVEGRLSYRSGYYSRSLVTRVGKLELRVPQDRHGRFSTEIFERYQRSEKALVAALTQMYIQGVSTRKVTAISEELCGHSFSASAISEVSLTVRPAAPGERIVLSRAGVLGATYQMIQPRLTLAAHLFVMACAHVL